MTAPPEQTPRGPAGPSSGQTADPFVQGTWAFHTIAQYLDGESKHSQEQFWSGEVGASFYFYDRAAVVMSVPFYYVQQERYTDAVAVGFTALARYHFYGSGGFSLYVDAGAGAILANRTVPAGGTNFNFIPQIGAGVTLPLAQNVSLIAGGRAFHLSNTGFRGTDHNPSINLGAEGYLGLMFLG